MFAQTPNKMTSIVAWSQDILRSLSKTCTLNASHYIPWIPQSFTPPRHTRSLTPAPMPANDTAVAAMSLSTMDFCSQRHYPSCLSFRIIRLRLDSTATMHTYGLDETMPTFCLEAQRCNVIKPIKYSSSIRIRRFLFSILYPQPLCGILTTFFSLPGFL